MGKDLLIAISFVLSIHPQSSGNTVIATESSVNQFRNGECGGTAALDQGTLIYPGDGFIQPGDICIWTIHLRTMDGFRLNFTYLDMPGGNSSCHRSAVSIYGLTNLIPRDNLETYRMCNENYNSGTYFLNSNIATVVFYASSSLAPNVSSYGFSLHWEGSRFQPVPTEHSSTYSIAPSGIVWFPFDGEYPPNAGMTWLTKGVRSSEPRPTFVDIDVIFVDLENCNLNDKCLCDALIIYDISRSGELHEVDRFCGDRNNGQFENINSNFIVAFYTDAHDDHQNGYGFQVVWRQGTDLGSTTETGEMTTEYPTTTSDNWFTTTTEYLTSTSHWETSTSENPTTTTTRLTTTVAPNTTECGGVLEGQRGSIHYKLGQPYENNELCIWTLRIKVPYTQIEITLIQSGFQLGHDYLSIFPFSKSGSRGSYVLGKTSNDYAQINVNGSVAILKFHSDSSGIGTGFRLEYRAVGGLGNVINHYRDVIDLDLYGELWHTRYASKELSTFVVRSDLNTRRRLLYYIQWCSSCSCDGILIYKLDAETITLRERLCGDSTWYLESEEGIFLFVFYSDATGGDPGFVLYRTEMATTPGQLQEE